MLYTSYIELSMSAYRSNINFIKDQRGEKAIISPVVKGNAYGHGIENIVSIAEGVGIRHFSTFSADEAYRVLNCSKKKSQIMIMGMLENDSLPWILQSSVSFYIFEFERLEATIEVANSLNIKAKFHIDVETGFHRTGFE